MTTFSPDSDILLTGFGISSLDPGRLPKASAQKTLHSFGKRLVTMKAMKRLLYVAPARG
ncbi:MAG: hypothetical protein F6K36_09560 [Symploca sp. SIO3C6]|uniref:Uncharacterized protein n=1 Tax=Symploca sp. SIO1C4 TaxID=2607765 RepID=A0A6B3NHQ9_9CYAN|nr:hypothetical protein [Symploca sp. SIO3C6]NER31240.1 hypothetical protein [Symploca sp. SIO1C4]